MSAGLAGTGKSTFNNIMVYTLSKQRIDYSVFHSSGNDTLSVTRGIWVYPKPLFSPNNPDT